MNINVKCQGVATQLCWAFFCHSAPPEQHMPALSQISAPPQVFYCPAHRCLEAQVTNKRGRHVLLLAWPTVTSFNVESS